MKTNIGNYNRLIYQTKLNIIIRKSNSMNSEIREYKKSDLPILTKIFPTNWNFDFEKFVFQFCDKKFYKGFTLLVNKNVVGFGNIMIFGKHAWLGNIVVEENYRNQGFGKNITNYLIDWGNKNRVETFNLIATELGEFVYRKLGFENEIIYDFYETSEQNKKYEINYQIKKAGLIDLPNIIELNYSVTGERRNKLIECFLPSCKLIFDKDLNLKAFFIEDLGDGFIVSDEPSFGIEFLKYKLNLNGKSITIPENNIHAKEFLTHNGFKKYKSAQKMILGKSYNWKPECVYSRASGYCG